MDKAKILEMLNAQCANTLMETLGIVFTDLCENSLSATMPITPCVHQPFEMLHGGASVALAETLGSCLSNISLQNSGQIAVGTQINAHHLKSKKKGELKGIAKILKKGKTLHLVEIEIRDEEDQLICHTTMTNMVINKN
ncbi:MAG: PaaI family thioesterase [Flavobacteriaceae bacterium]|nr:PaaI family thioesterase [Flavobacteriaceae bacterium]